MRVSTWTPSNAFSLLLDNCHREDQIAGTDIVNHILTLYDLAEAGVNAIEVLRVAAIVADEEL